MTTCQHAHPDDIMSQPTVTVKRLEVEISFHPESDVGRAHAVRSGMTDMPTFCRHGFFPMDCLYCSEPAPFFKERIAVK